ncbi:hypothetical protein [Halovivax limisalsi]|uniref:hypothetical protein n=1 Tax=Halovivax limisalsi TaxID=1453760 RepID=UPI001FFCED53|nr:hypothetical protein [Halovivax limisalsi]
MDLGIADVFTHDLYSWIRSRPPRTNDARFRSDLRRYLRRYVGNWADQELNVDHTGGARGVDYVVGDEIAIVLIETITEGSNQWLYRELGSISQQYEYVVVIGHNLAEEHVDVWRSLGRRMATRSNSTFRFLTAEELWDPVETADAPIRTVNGALGVGAVVITYLAVSINAIRHFAPTDPMAGAFVAAVFVLLSVVLCYTLFFVRAL